MESCSSGQKSGEVKALVERRTTSPCLCQMVSRTFTNYYIHQLHGAIGGVRGTHCGGWYGSCCGVQLAVWCHYCDNPVGDLGEICVMDSALGEGI